MSGEVSQARLSKAISRLLRHRPDELARGVDADRWAFVDDVVIALEGAFPDARIDAGVVVEVVSDPRNPRFELSHDRIRAKYGHSAVEYQAHVTRPPSVLFHATPEDSVDVIMGSGGLSPMRRRFVHMSVNPERAMKSARHHRRPLTVLRIDADAAFESGVEFHSPDGVVWLAPDVSSKYLAVISEL